ncbi:MAG: aldo/keto reductase, partial [Thermoleophilia bacterium]|nr:aldo/keto reductase [Thermoleophilia bacterium]
MGPRDPPLRHGGVLRRGRSERWIGEWAAERGREPVLATKVFHSVTGDPADRGLAPDRIRRELAGSLQRLGLERVDLYLIHEPDPETPVADTLGALRELAAEGLVGAVGASNVDVPFLRRARGFQWVQNSHSLLEQDEEVLAFCAGEGLGYTPFGPLAGGWLTGKYRRGEPHPPGSRMRLRPEPYARFVDDRVFDAL